MAIESIGVDVASLPEDEFREWLRGFRLKDPLIQQDPYPVYARLRDQYPVFHSEADGGFWVFSTYEDVKYIHQHPEIFSTRHISIPRMEYPLGPEIPLHIEPPEHMKYRQPMLPLFTAAEANAAEAQVRATAIRLLEPIQAKGSCDFLADFAVPMPCMTFCQLMGLPLEHLDHLLAWKESVLRSDPAGRGDHLNEMYAGTMALFAGIYDERMSRGEPGDDLIGKFMTLSYGRERQVTRDEFIRTARFLTLAGLDTITAQLSLFAYHLGMNPDLRDRLTEDPSRIPAAVEELMRFDTLVGVARDVVQDVTVHGIEIKAGEMVLTLLNSANRDEAVFDRPDEIDLERHAANLQLGFGVGPHRCIGSHLARMELRVALEEMHRMIPTYRVDVRVPVEMHLGSVRGIDSLHLIID